MDRNWFLIYIHHMKIVGNMYMLMDQIDGIDQIDLLNYYKWKGSIYPYGN